MENVRNHVPKYPTLQHLGVARNGSNAQSLADFSLNYQEASTTHLISLTGCNHNGVIVSIVTYRVMRC
jgi:hypothetical protein